MNNAYMESIDIVKLLKEKKIELLSGLNTSDNVTFSYNLGAYNLCDELLNAIIPSGAVTELFEKLNGEKTRWAIKESDYYDGYNIITGSEEIILECVGFMEHCFQKGYYFTVLDMARKLFPQLKWDYVIGESYEEMGVKQVYIKEAGCFPIQADDEWDAED